MKVMVTGSHGLVGTPLVDHLNYRGHEVVSYDLKEGCDTLNHRTLARYMAGCDVVVHLSAIAWPHPHKDWYQFWRHNCLAVQEVAATSVASGVKRLVFTSSTAYYGFEANVPLRINAPAKEGEQHISQYLRADDLAEVTPQAVYYIQSKVIAENILAVYGLTKMLQVAVLRLCPVRGDPYLGLNVYNENVTPALVKLVETDREMWYEAFNLANPSVDLIDTGKWDTFWGDEWQYC